MSVALLSARAAAPAFNSDFYVTAASVIPVLFLAIAFQSQFQQDLLSVAFRPMHSMLRGPTPANPFQVLRPFTAILTYLAALWATGILIVLILFFGVVGEIVAIGVLAAQSHPSTAAQLARLPVAGIVFYSVVFLTCVVAATSALVLAKFVVRLRSDLRAVRRSRQAANREARAGWLLNPPDAALRRRQAADVGFPAGWRPNAPDDGGFSDPPLITSHGTVIVFPSPLDGSMVQKAYPHIVDGDQVRVTDSMGTLIGIGKLTYNPRQTAAVLKTAIAESGLAASELTAVVAVYNFTVKVPAGLTRYGIILGQNEKKTYKTYKTAAQMKNPSLTLGSPPG